MMRDTEGEGVPGSDADPVHQRLLRMNRAPRCRARTRVGTPCRLPATAKGRCRMHGGAKGSGGPEGERNGAWRHGGRAGRTLLLRRMEWWLLRLARMEQEEERKR